jgi:ATP-binding cassette, subfamily C, type I secretion system permease/ATPase
MFDGYRPSTCTPGVVLFLRRWHARTSARRVTASDRNEIRRLALYDRVESGGTALVPGRRISGLTLLLLRRARRHAGRKFASLWARIQSVLAVSFEYLWPNPPEDTVNAPALLRGSDALTFAKRTLHRPCVAALTFSLAINLLALTTSIYMSQIYDRVLTTFSIETLVLLTFMALGLLLLLVLIDQTRNQLLTIAVLRAEQDLGGPLLAAAVNDQLRGRPDAALPLRDLVTLRNFATSPAFTAIFDGPMTVVYIAVMFLIHWALGVATLAGAVAMIVIARSNQYATQEQVKIANRASNGLSSTADLQIRNAEAIQAMGLMDSLQARWQIEQDRVLEAQVSAHARGRLFEGLARYLRLAMQILAMCLGAALVLSGRITPGMMFAASIILSRALQPIEITVSSWRTIVAARDNYERVRDALARAGSGATPMALPAPDGAVSLKQVAVLAGRERKVILRSISFALAPGDTLGIIGPAASGKSTLARTILGIVETSAGKVRLDGNDITKWPRQALGRHVGYLPQDVELFPATVAENIARMGEVEPEAVIAAARLAGVHEMVQRLPDGYDTRIMTGGLLLSPGQRQRLALARALHGAPKLIILDEPNSNLDGEGEEALERALQEMKKWRATIIVIAHRLGVLRNIEKVLLLRDGVVQAFGPRDEILARLTQRPGQSQAGTVVPMLSVVATPGAPT